ncbi:MAG: shikimate dehydrogenase [Ectothiorhodospiraceae bacterium]|nr:shikimate dehydrogenase [Ectothiorhodospiraceae bacterium]
MGNPITHSKSPQIHAAFAAQTGQRVVYSATQVDPGGFEQAVGNFFAHNGKGLNITVPFKREAWALAGELGPEAKLAGAVNTLLMDKDGVLVGRNTDGLGLVRDILHNHGGRIEGQKVLLIGAGGAARGVLQPLLAEAPAELLIVNRTPNRAYELATDFSAVCKEQSNEHMPNISSIKSAGFDDLANTKQSFDLIINATAASLQGEVPPLPDACCTANTWCYDMMYSAEPTPFMQWGEQRGAKVTLDGLGMLVEQAAESFLHWRGVRPKTAPVIQKIRAELLNTL